MGSAQGRSPYYSPHLVRGSRACWIRRQILCKVLWALALGAPPLPPTPRKVPEKMLLTSTSKFNAFFDANKSQQMLKMFPKWAQDGANIAQKSNFETKRATSILTGIYCTSWPLTPPQEELKSAPKPHQKSRNFSNLNKSLKTTKLLPKGLQFELFFSFFFCTLVR